MVSDKQMLPKCLSIAFKETLNVVALTDPPIGSIQASIAETNQAVMREEFLRLLILGTLDFHIPVVSRRPTPVRTESTKL
jgi:hypothetical protein